MAAFVLCLSLAAAACGGSGSEPATDTPASTPQSPAAPVTTTQRIETPTATLSPTASATPAPAVVTPSTGGPGAPAAIAAAEQQLGAVHLDVLARAACEAANPPNGLCISLQSDPQQAASGLLRFTAGSLDGGGFRFYMGRDLADEWAFWFGTQQQSEVPDALPGDLLACSAAGPAAVFAGPAALSSSTGSVARLVLLRAEAFVLTTPGSFAVDGGRGEGWYYVSSPVMGWVAAADVTSAVLGDCLLHDDLAAGERG